MPGNPSLQLAEISNSKRGRFLRLLLFVKLRGKKSCLCKFAHIYSAWKIAECWAL